MKKPAATPCSGQRGAGEEGGRQIPCPLLGGGRIQDGQGHRCAVCLQATTKGAVLLRWGCINLLGLSGQDRLDLSRLSQEASSEYDDSDLCSFSAGLTEVEKEEGEAAKRALAEEAGERPQDAEGSDDENYKKNNQFSEHMKRKNEAVRNLAAAYILPQLISCTCCSTARSSCGHQVLL
jgi:hypothetical protein